MTHSCYLTHYIYIHICKIEQFLNWDFWWTTSRNSNSRKTNGFWFCFILAILVIGKKSPRYKNNIKSNRKYFWKILQSTISKRFIRARGKLSLNFFEITYLKKKHVNFSIDLLTWIFVLSISLQSHRVYQKLVWKNRHKKNSKLDSTFKNISDIEK